MYTYLNKLRAQTKDDDILGFYWMHIFKYLKNYLNQEHILHTDFRHPQVGNNPKYWLFFQVGAFLVKEKTNVGRPVSHQYNFVIITVFTPSLQKKKDQKV